MKRMLFAAGLIAAVAPAYACSDARWNWLNVSAAKSHQLVTAARRYSQDDPQTFIDAAQTYTEWADAVVECEAERQAGNLQ